MSNSVITVSTKEIEAMKAAYAPHLQANQPPGSIFMAKPPGCTITAYKSGKVLFQGANASEESGRWSVSASHTSSTAKPKATKKAHAYAPPSSIGSLSIIGSDEVGTGDYFGPITVVASYVSASQLALVKELGVKDSKFLKDDQIVAIAKDLIHIVPYSLLILSNQKYNELQSKGMSQGKMKAMLHNQALQNMLKKVPTNDVDGILIDQFCEPGVYYNYLSKAKNVVNEGVYFATKGESLHLSVAASSIIARYAFIKEMDKISAATGQEIPKGAGRKVDVRAAELIRKHGLDYLYPIAKMHFANTEKAKNLAAGHLR
ncbi:ribonuclease HIII [Fictibacillus macauensis ZFHKF-1]|uniref:Ribonuclease HIII n=1 Tax=Fictibacillus macauensis ZFHKF-1 TaxID=1196324 RepID=I8UF26_9BACL|nr:ribonuclease HIII [Fictibacillus macauensis]EIT85418.1 ribonuclease HIII [Fictibacillus macauensis ZFHKF-1]